MKILITGAAGFVGKNLAASLRNIQEGKDRTHPELSVETLYLYDMDSPHELLDTACKEADFVFSLSRGKPPPRPCGVYEGEFRLRFGAFGYA